MHSWGEIAKKKFDDLLVKLFFVFEAHRIKGVTPFRSAKAAKQLVIHVRHRKVSALILIIYRHFYLQKEQCMNKTFALIRSLPWLIISACRPRAL